MTAANQESGTRFTCSLGSVNQQFCLSTCVLTYEEYGDQTDTTSLGNKAVKKDLLVKNKSL